MLALTLTAAILAVALIGAILAQLLMGDGLRQGWEVRFAGLDTGETSHLIPLAAMGAVSEAHVSPPPGAEAQTMRPG